MLTIGSTMQLLVVCQPFGSRRFRGRRDESVRQYIGESRG